MKEVCSPTSVHGGWYFGTRNYSKDHKAGGLNIKLNGIISSVTDFGYDIAPWQNPGDAIDTNDNRMMQKTRGPLGVYWTASNADYDGAYSRFFNMNFANVDRMNTYKVQLFSVRCIKK